jgi:hypothetical protein
MAKTRPRRGADEEVEIVEDDRRVLKDGTVEVREHWVARANGCRTHRRAHERSRPRRRR